MTPRTTVLAPAILAVLGGCGGGGASTPDAPPTAPDAAPRQVVMETKSLLVGQLIEATMTGGPTDLATIHFSVATPDLDWNIHIHPGNESINVVEELGQSTVDYVFQPTEQTDYFLIIRNGGTAPIDVDVEIGLYGALGWSDWQ